MPRVAADDRLEQGGVAGGVLLHIGLPVPGADRLDGRLEVEDMALFRLFPDEVAREDDRAGPQSLREGRLFGRFSASCQRRGRVGALREAPLRPLPTTLLCRFAREG